MHQHKHIRVIDFIFYPSYPFHCSQKLQTAKPLKLSTAVKNSSFFAAEKTAETVAPTVVIKKNTPSPKTSF